MQNSLLSSLAEGEQTPLTQAGSNRQYFRIRRTDGSMVVGVVGTSREENHAFIVLSRHFAAMGLNVPRVLAVSDDEMAYVQDDLGDVSLFDAIAAGRRSGGEYGDDEKRLLEKTIIQLTRLQTLGDRGLDYSVCYPQPEMDSRNILFDLNYFKYCFLKPLNVDFHENRLQDDFEAFARDLLADCGPWGFMMRDCQARNVMLRDGEPYFIDYQGGRRGPLLYDVASFLWQASARYPHALRREMFDVYARHLPHAVTWEQLRRIVLLRTLQVLGAYGYRGLFERKPHFIASIPPALDNLREVVGEAAGYPELHAALQALISQQMLEQKTFDNSRLKVRVFSFSYKRGIPEDVSGNGGGYVFDCRSTHNPGRYAEYKQLTGLDQPVIDFLERDGEITTFLESVCRLADAHVERYMERGFTDLMFSFGCTGGQHRSVYSAEHLARHLNSKFGIEVELCHREQGIHSTLPQKPSEC
ncbi:MAG: phosphotransferase [Bacteroidaceae bacterium]|nr:phosphotransferase [Bacteroidaceae bacterium]